MNLKDIAREPQLVQVELVVEGYDEPLTFYTWDRQPITNFIKLANMNTGDMEQMMSAVRSLVLDSDGKEILGEKMVLPNKVMIEVIQKVTETLGK